MFYNWRNDQCIFYEIVMGRTCLLCQESPNDILFVQNAKPRLTCTNHPIMNTLRDEGLGRVLGGYEMIDHTLDLFSYISAFTFEWPGPEF